MRRIGFYPDVWFVVRSLLGTLAFAFLMIGLTWCFTKLHLKLKV